MNSRIARASGLDRIRSNLIANGLTVVVPALAQLLATPILLWKLGDQSYGVYVAVLSLVGALGLLNLGVASAATKYIAQVDIQSDEDKLQGVVSSSFSLYLFIGLVVSCGVYLLAPFIVSMVFVETELPSWQLIELVRLTGLLFSVNLLRAAMSSVFRGFQRYDIAAVIQAGYFGLLILFQVAAVLLGGGVKEIILVSIIASSIVLATNMVVVKKLFIPRMQFLRVPDPRIFRILFTFGVFLTIANVGGMLLTSADKLVIVRFLGAATVTYYAIPAQLLGYMHQLGATFSSLLFPLASELDSVQDTLLMRKLYLRSTRLIVMLTSIPTIALALFSTEILSLWVNHSFAQIAAPIMTISVLGYLFQYCAIVPYYFLLGTGKSRVVAIVLIGIATVSIFFLGLGVRAFGLRGGAVGMSLGLSTMLVYPWHVQRSLNVPWREAAKDGYGATLGYSLVSVVLGLIFAQSLPWRIVIYLAFLLFVFAWGNAKIQDWNYLRLTVCSARQLFSLDVWRKGAQRWDCKR